MGFQLVTGVPLVDLYRGGYAESTHTGSVVVLEPDGRVSHAVGSVGTPVLPRSANKPMQAVAMVRSGLDLTGADLALAAASHSGEPEHVRRVQAILRRTGLEVEDLQCPADYPINEAARDGLIRLGLATSPVYMNCSGKHTAMLRTCRHNDWPADTYLDPAHPLQQQIAETIADLAGEPVAGEAVDGCGAPVLALTLVGLARSFSRLAQAEAGTPECAVATAMRDHPFLVAGTGREDTGLMGGVPGLLMKGGAEGVHAFALSDGRAVALKVDDGAQRARVPLLLAALAHLGVDVTGLASPEPVLGGGVPVGELRVRPALFPPT